MGISFYTFQSLSYTLDVYKKKIKPTNNLLTFLAFVSFFPQLVAGPIERAKSLLPQFSKKRKFDYDTAVDGSYQILWGLFKKIVIADNCAIFVNQIFDGYAGMNGSTLLLGAVLFGFQIYCDFSGYSDMAIGLAKLLGFKLMTNFSYPYFSRDIAEFWRRWHISLTSWFKDYIYIPLGGSRGGMVKTLRNIFVIFLISGMWHGANWTFVVWGLLNAAYFVPLILMKSRKAKQNIGEKQKTTPQWEDMLEIWFTFLLVSLAWVFFRAESLSDAMAYLSRIFSSSLMEEIEVLPLYLFGLIGVMLVLEWFQRTKEHPFNFGLIKWKPIRWLSYYLVISVIFHFTTSGQDFIYFQF